MKTESEIITINDWIIRYREPIIKGESNLILLLHGWTGDENAMWVFADRLPGNAYLLAPRGMYSTPLGGFGWHESKPNAWPWVDDFLPAIDALNELLDSKIFQSVNDSLVSLVGFSQGAALAYAYALQNPQRVAIIAGLSGFLPGGVEALARNKPLLGKSTFIAHGTQDELVPVERARTAVGLLESAGAQVSYCEDDVGHKLSANCYRGLELFFASSRL